MSVTMRSTVSWFIMPSIYNGVIPPGLEVSKFSSEY